MAFPYTADLISERISDFFDDRQTESGTGQRLVAGGLSDIERFPDPFRVQIVISKFVCDPKTALPIVFAEFCMYGAGGGVFYRVGEQVGKQFRDQLCISRDFQIRCDGCV